MNIDDFRRVLSAFTDQPADVDLTKGVLLAELRDELIEARIRVEAGDLVVEENGDSMSAGRWLVYRVARLQLLADRILSAVPAEPAYIEPSGSLLDHLEDRPDEAEIAGRSVSTTAFDVLGRHRAGVTSVLYLVSDAGEGKTTVISQMARRQADRFRNREQAWLLLPISLAGRPFLRFDDVIVGALMNRFRFPLLYFQAFIELVRMGVIVPALDGFEEMFVESPNRDAISSLGLLVEHLSGEGTVMIAARKAYFEFRRLDTQARLFDTLGNHRVSFARLSIDRWSADQFDEYCHKCGLSNGRQLHSAVANVVGADHPLLTRAVLVRQLVQLASTAGTTDRLLQQLRVRTDNYFGTFVESILEREATEKWIDKSGDAARPLLTVGQHRQLLAAIAREMWLGRSSYIELPLLETVATVFAEDQRLPLDAARQVSVRVAQHALLVEHREGRQRYTFDHEEFYHFFLGLALSEAVACSDRTQTRDMLRQGALPPLAIESAACLLRDSESAVELVQFLSGCAVGEGLVSFVNTNAGTLVLSLLDQRTSSDAIVVSALTFAADALHGRCLQNLTFEGCSFHATTLSGGDWRALSFVGCRFDGLNFGTDFKARDCEVRDCEVLCVSAPDEEVATYDPKKIRGLLRGHGISVIHSVVEDDTLEIQRTPLDEEVELTERALRAFMRSTEVNEHVFLQRLGAKGPLFISDALPRLLEAGLLVEVPYRGSGRQRRFRLGVALNDVRLALAEAEGSFSGLLQAVARTDRV